MHKIPEELARELKKAGLAEYFDECTDSHRRQYQLWIDEAKKPEIRQRRVEQAVKLIAAKAAEDRAREERRRMKKSAASGGD